MASRKVGMFGVEPNEFIDDRNEDGVAALLRRRREELGRDVPTVARQLRIRAVYITAIEEGRLQDLPGTAYAVGFVRAYADYLGLDGSGAGAGTHRSIGCCDAAGWQRHDSIECTGVASAAGGDARAGRLRSGPGNHRGCGGGRRGGHYCGNHPSGS